MDAIADYSLNEQTMAVELSTLSKLKEIKVDSSSNDDNNMKSTNHDFVYEGHIFSFVVNDNIAYGFISSSTEKNLYFNIRQVEDQELRDMLWNGILQKATVSFTIGTGVHGGKSADHITPIESITTLHEIKEGMIISYGEYDSYGNRYGIIQCSGKNYLFRDNAVIDPALRAYFDNAFSVKNVYVKFIGKKEKKNHIVSKVWFDETEERKLIEEYKSSTDKREYDAFLQIAYDLEHGSMSSCPFSYEPLLPWKDESPIIPAVKTVYQPPAGSDMKTGSESEHSSKQSSRSFSRFGIRELLAKGNNYLTKAKDLEKAEAYFMEVLSRHPERVYITLRSPIL